MRDTHVVAALKHTLHFLVHVMVIHGHEHGVHNDAQRDEELNEGIEDNEGDPFLKFQPNPAAVPHTKHIDAFEDRLERLVFERWPILVVVLCWEIVNGDWTIQKFVISCDLTNFDSARLADCFCIFFFSVKFSRFLIRSSFVAFMKVFLFLFFFVFRFLFVEASLHWKLFDSFFWVKQKEKKTNNTHAQCVCRSLCWCPGYVCVCVWVCVYV